ncbi:calcium-binding protein [Amphritea balenae]|nr:calcium-binding protein [Amphritea balenae]GGK55165.1 hemolysin-type calcium-binding protein [Amphritea balenae]
MIEKNPNMNFNEVEEARLAEYNGISRQGHPNTLGVGYEGYGGRISASADSNGDGIAGNETSFGNYAGNTLGVGNAGLGSVISALADPDGDGVAGASENGRTSGENTNGFGNSLGIGYAGFGSEVSGSADTNADGVADSAGSSSGSSGGGYAGAYGFPLVIDMDGDGIELTPVDESVTTFDFDNDGYNELTAWTSSDDALLVFDLDNDNQVTQAKEIAFAQWTEAEDTDLQALASEFDTNQDGVLDQNDAGWSSFKLWQDRDLNGQVDEGEMQSLDEAGIRSISMTPRENTGSVLSDGTEIHGLVDVERDNGELLNGADVAFRYNSKGFRTVIDDSGNRVYEFEDGSVLKSRVLAESEQDFDLGTSETDWISAEGNQLANLLNGSAKTESILLSGGDGDDQLLGGAGNDFIIGGAGADTLTGGAGHDMLFVDADDLSVAGQVDGGEGYDQLILTDNAAVIVDVESLGVEAVVSGDGADQLSGSIGDVSYIFNSGGGDDQLQTAGGHDVLIAGEGDDTLSSGAGQDTLIAGQGDDLLNAGDDDDFLAGGAGQDTLNGGAGNDTYLYNRGDGQDRIHDYAEGIYQEKYDYKESVDYQEQYSYYERVKRKSGKRTKWVNELRTGYRTATREEDRTGYREVYGEIDGGIDTLQFGIGIALSDLVLSRSGEDMVVQLRDQESPDQLSDDQVTIVDWADQKNRIETFAFSDGNRLDFSQIMQGKHGFAADDQLEGSDEGDFLSGGAGADNLKGNGGNDILTGGDGADQLLGGEGKDLLFGDSGDDHIQGESGDDYLIGADGSDNLDGGDGDDVIAGMNGDDTLSAGEGDDLLLGGAGNDLLQGGAGDDTYIYFRGDGKDEIYDYKTVEETYQERYVSGQRYRRSGKSGRWVNEYRTRTKTRTVHQDAGNDSLQFGYSIALADLFFETQGDDLLIGIRDLTDADTALSELNDQLTIKRWAHEENRIETFEFANGLELDMSAITFARSGYESNDQLEGTDAGDILSGGGGNDSLNGFAGDDYLIGGSGDDLLSGGAGDDDQFGGQGNDTLSGGEGTDYLLGGEGDDTLDAGVGNDVITGGLGDDLLKGGLGNDIYIFNRGDGKDAIDESAYTEVEETYTYTERVTRPKYTWKGSSWGGVVTVNETRTGYKTVSRAVEGGDDTLQFGAYIDISDLIISMDGNDLLIQLKPLDIDAEVSDQITVKEWLTPEFRVEHLRFINDFAVDIADIEFARTGASADDVIATESNTSSWLAGADGNDQISASDSADILFGGEGDDSISGGQGDDIYIYNLGDGHDTLSDTGSSAVGENAYAPGGDKLLFGAGITIEHLVLQRSGDDLRIYVRESSESRVSLSELNDSILITDWAQAGNRIEVLQFFDGKDFDISQVTQTFIGSDLGDNTGPVNDQLTGSDDANWLDGFGGNDSLKAAEGNDYLFGRAGDDFLAGNQGKDILSGGSGDDQLMGGMGDDLLAGDAGNDALFGNQGNDILLGGAGDDQVNGGFGDDYIIGDKGSDTYTASEGFDIYKFGFGDGQDTYIGANESEVVNSDLLLLEDDISKGALWFERVDNDLVMRLLGSDDQIQFSDWYAQESDEKSVIAFQAGEDLLYAKDVNTLVSAMASFTPNDGTTAYGIRSTALPEPIKLAVDSAWRAA